VAAVSGFKLNWYDLSDELKADREIAKAALKKRPCNSGHSSILRCLSCYDLPLSLQNDEVFCEEICHIVPAEELEFIFDYHPAIKNKRSFWLEFIDTVKEREEGGYDVDNCMELFEEILPDQFRSDYDVMLGLCQHFFSMLLWLVEAPLDSNRPFYKAILEDNPVALGSVYEDIQRRFPDLVMKCVDALSNVEVSLSMVKDIADGIPLALWDRNFVLRWVIGGMPITDDVPPEFRNDKEILLLAAKHSRRADEEEEERDCRLFSIESFKSASRALLNDKSFMLKVLQHDSGPFQCLPEHLQQDIDLVALAFSSDVKMAKQFLHTYPDRVDYERGPYRKHVEFLKSQRSRMEALLEKYDNFSSVVLFGMSQGANSGSALALLDQGPVTSLNYKRAIASFLEVPSGKDAHLFRKACRNISTIIRNHVPHWF